MVEEFTFVYKIYPHGSSYYRMSVVRKTLLQTLVMCDYKAIKETKSKHAQ